MHPIRQLTLVVNRRPIVHDAASADNRICSDSRVRKDLRPHTNPGRGRYVSGDVDDWRHDKPVRLQHFHEPQAFATPITADSDRRKELPAAISPSAHPADERVPTVEHLCARDYRASAAVVVDQRNDPVAPVGESVCKDFGVTRTPPDDPMAATNHRRTA